LGALLRFFIQSQIWLFVARRLLLGEAARPLLQNFDLLRSHFANVRFLRSGGVFAVKALFEAVYEVLVLFHLPLLLVQREVSIERLRIIHAAELWLQVQ